MRFDEHFGSGKYDPKRYWSLRAKEAKEKGNLINAVCTYDRNELIRNVRNKAMDYIQKEILAYFLKNENFSNKKVLEIGCGIGRWVEFFTKRGALYYGVDISDEMVNIAKELFPDVEIRVYNIDKGLPFEEETFDYIFTITVLHHNPYEIQESIIKEAGKLVKNKGKFIIFEDIKGNSFNMFPNSLSDWVKKFNKYGFEYKRHKLVRYFFLKGLVKKFVRRELISLYKLCYIEPFVLRYLNIPERLATTAVIEFQKN